MSITDAAKIDKNFYIPTKISKAGLEYHGAEELDIYGIKHIDGIYRRMRAEDALTVNENIELISRECAGGRVRFITDSPYISIFVKYRAVAKLPNYGFTATMGFDLYSRERHIGTFVPPFDATESMESVIDVENSDGAREYTVNFPVCSVIEDFYLGIKSGSILTHAPKYKIAKPIVFYGSSTTQGACASRPGNTYENVISRELDADYVNLGFWGNAKGEDEIAKYISRLEMSAFVYDYDYNTPSVEHLQNTHERMFRIIREAQPELPIIILSAPKFYLDEKGLLRHSIIENTYKNAIGKGDKSVSFISGKEMMRAVKDTAIVDNIHPGDSGFSEMAKHISRELKKFL